jgi:NADH-quinone oxidoreductase subunit N
MTYGNLAALNQRNLKRLLAYSSIAHAGYMLVGVLAAAISIRNEEAAGAVLYYLVIYGFTTVGAFALAAWLARNGTGDDIDDLNGLGFRSPGLALCIVVLMLSLIGVPPLAGFFGKLYMFLEALDSRESGRWVMVGLVALALLNSVISAFYYVRVLKAMFLRTSARPAAPPPPGGIRWPIVLATLVVVVFGVFPPPLLNTMRAAATPMLTSAKSVSRYATGVAPNAAEAAEANKREALRMRDRLQSASPGGGGGGGGAPAAAKSAGAPAAPKASSEQAKPKR